MAVLSEAAAVLAIHLQTQQLLTHLCPLSIDEAMQMHAAS